MGKRIVRVKALVNTPRHKRSRGDPEAMMLDRSLVRKDVRRICCKGYKICIIDVVGERSSVKVPTTDLRKLGFSV